MSTKFQKTSSQLFLIAFIGIIIVSFIFSGPFLGGGGAPDSIGSVGGHDIKVREFNGEVQRQSNFYSQFMKGGKPLTTAELKQFKIYDNAIQSLVFSKLRLILADKIGITPSEEEIKQQIKDAKYFQTGDKFDINKYKALLSYNSITPEDFEKDTANGIKATRLQKSVSTIHLSKSLESDLNNLYNMRKNTKVVTLNFTEFRKNLKVSNKEITEYLAQENNKKKVESQFNQRKETLSVKEQVKARHILFKVEGDDAKALAKAKSLRKKLNTGNFISLAKKNTDEAQGKKNGGDLKWVTRGQMVKPFEQALFAMKKGEISQPVKTQFGYHIIYAVDKKAAKEAKLAEHERAIAKEMIQKDSDIADKVKTAKAEVLAALERGKLPKSLERKYSLSVKENQVINRLEGFQGGFSFDSEKVDELFKADKVHVFEEALKVTFINVEPYTNKDLQNFDSKPVKNVVAQSVVKSLLDKLSTEYSFNRNKLARLPN